MGALPEGDASPRGIGGDVNWLHALVLCCDFQLWGGAWAVGAPSTLAGGIFLPQTFSGLGDWKP